MKKVVIGIIIVIVIIGTISAYSMTNPNSNTNEEIISSDVIPEPTGVIHLIELTEGLTMTAPGP